MPESTWAESNTVVTTKPRTREEVREELREELRLLEMPRLPAEEKERLEREAVESSVGEVELFERSWRKTAPETIGDIQRKVDALGTSPLPPAAAAAAEARSTPQLPAPVRASTLDLTPAPGPLPARAGRPLASRLTPAEQRAIAKHLGGTLVRAVVVFSTSRGRVVDVTWKKGDEERLTTVIVDAEGDVATLDAIGARLDAMALPRSLPGPVRSVEEALEPPAAVPPPAGPAAAPAARSRRVVDPGPSGRTPAGLLPTVANQDVIRIEGVGEVYARKLRAVGIEIIEDLCLCDAAQVADAAGLTEDLVAKWQAMGRLQAVSGVGPQYSELLVRAGIPTMSELARQKPEALAQRLNDYEASLGVRVQGTSITTAQTQDWIAQARKLTRTAPEASRGDTGATAAPEAPAKKAPKKPKAEAPAKKGFALPFGKKAAKDELAAEPPAEEPEAGGGGDKPKKRFGLPFGRK